jgi:D-sedoheptulose 7-phosphate isomerase
MSDRSEAGLLLSNDAERVVRACHAMAARFHRGGKLIVFGDGAASADAEHVAVEFVHPVIVGKRALPAIALAHDGSVDGAAFSHQMRYLAASDDIAMGFSSDGGSGSVLRALEVAHQARLLALALVADDGGAIAKSSAVEFAFAARSRDPMIVKEIHVTTYHILWELVHVFLEQPGILQPGFIR